MHQKQRASPMPSYWSETPEHSNALEHRVTTLEVTTSGTEKRLRYVEKALQAIIYALAALASSKSGDAVEVLLSILKAKL